MSVEETNMAAIRLWLEEGWSKGNVDVADQMIAPGFKVHGAGGQVISSGPDGAKELVRIWRRAMPDGMMTIDDMFAENDLVVIRMTWRGTHLGEFYGTPASGKQITCTSIGIDRLENGKVVEGWGELDMLGMMQTMGAIPSPGQ
jgi:steroid delta-isomerase-like uncharacterized protein